MAISKANSFYTGLFLAFNFFSASICPPWLRSSFRARSAYKEGAQIIKRTRKGFELGCEIINRLDRLRNEFLNLNGFYDSLNF